jgi:DNA sulfur modification protein DndD
LRRLTSENVALLLLKNHVSEISVLSDQHRARKHIPADFKQSFIADLLSSGSCICGSDLVEGQKHYVQVSSRLQEGAVTGTEEQWNVLANGMKRTEFEFKQFVQKFREAINAVHDEGLEIAALEEELEVISREIVRMSNNVPNPEKIQSLEIERKKVLESIESLKRDKAQLEVLIDQENGKIRKLEKKIEMIIPQNEAAKLAKLQQQYLLGVCDLLKKDLDRIRIEKRFELQEKTTHIFRSLSTLNYSCQLDDNFVLRMVGYSDDSEQLNRAMGTGDTLMMYYSFVAALSKMSLDDAGAEGKNLSFPMMIDAPFTPLDGGPKRRVAENLIGFTHQLAYFCLKDQLVINDSPVVKDKTGRVAVYHYFGSGGGVLSEENIELENQIYPYFSHGKKVEHYSEILVVK